MSKGLDTHNMSATEYFERKVSLLSTSDVRYDGELYTVDPEEQSIALKHVNCLGTEGRRHGDQAIQPSECTYEFIIFRVVNIKELYLVENGQKKDLSFAILAPLRKKGGKYTDKQHKSKKVEQKRKVGGSTYNYGVNNTKYIEQGIVAQEIDYPALPATNVGKYTRQEYVEEPRVSYQAYYPNEYETQQTKTYYPKAYDTNIHQYPTYIYDPNYAIEPTTYYYQNEVQEAYPRYNYPQVKYVDNRIRSYKEQRQIRDYPRQNYSSRGDYRNQRGYRNYRSYNNRRYPMQKRGGFVGNTKPGTGAFLDRRLRGNEENDASFNTDFNFKDIILDKKVEEEEEEKAKEEIKKDDNLNENIVKYDPKNSFFDGLQTQTRKSQEKTDLQTQKQVDSKTFGSVAQSYKSRHTAYPRNQQRQQNNYRRGANNMYNNRNFRYISRMDNNYNNRWVKK